MNYIGREKELRLLRELRSKSAEAALCVVYGRRRVGKSSLIAEAYKNERCYVFEGLENQSSKEQIANFARQLREHFPQQNIGKLDSWHSCLLKLSEVTKDKPCVILFDEFQWMANYRSKLVSQLKLFWDQHFSKNQYLTFVLCGSIASFMLGKVIKSKALYGRVLLGVNLKPFVVAETAQMLPSWSTREVLEAHLLLGGIPQYLKILSLKSSLTLGIQELAFEPHGYFVDEFDKIFVSQFASSEHYEKLTRLLSRNPRGLTRQQIVAKGSDFKDGGALSKYLKDLEIAGIITSYYPFHSAPNAKTKIYILSDPYIRLYLKYIEKELPRIESDVPRIFVNLSKDPGFLSWKGLSAEIMCLRHKHLLAKLMGFSDVEYQAGPYFQQRNKNLEGAQVDLVYDRRDSVITVCEIKYTDRPIGVEIIEEVERKVALIPNKKNKSIQTALITKSPASIELGNKAYFSHIISLDELV